MKQNIAKWYQSCGVCLATPEQYDQRIESIKDFTGKKFELSSYCELVKCFMGMSYDIQKLDGFINVFNENDISFSEKSVKEIPLLAGMCLYNYMNSGYGDELGVMNQSSQYGRTYDNYLDSRRHYTETKDEKDKEMMRHDAKEHMHGVEHTMKDIWKDADPTLKKELKAQMEALINDMRI